MADSKTAGSDGIMSNLLSGPIKGVVRSVGHRAVSTVTDKLTDMTDRLSDYAGNGGGPGLWSAITGKDGSGSGDKDSGSESKNGATKATNIVEKIDVGLPLSVCYNQWTQFEDFPSFMKKVENIDQETKVRMSWKAQVFLSHRTWESKIVEQVPDKRIVWTSTGDKGYANGAVTFHELAPELTRILLILEYHPQGLFERVGNIWRAQGRRARLELKHFARQAMTKTILHPDEVKGWRGEIHEGKVTKSGKDAEKASENGKNSTGKSTSRNTSSSRRQATSRS